MSHSITLILSCPVVIVKLKLRITINYDFTHVDKKGWLKHNLSYPSIILTQRVTQTLRMGFLDWFVPAWTPFWYTAFKSPSRFGECLIHLVRFLIASMQFLTEGTEQEFTIARLKECPAQKAFGCISLIRFWMPDFSLLMLNTPS